MRCFSCHRVVVFENCSSEMSVDLITSGLIIRLVGVQVEVICMIEAKALEVLIRELGVTSATLRKISHAGLVRQEAVATWLLSVTTEVSRS